MFFYTPFREILPEAIRHGGGQCASTDNGKCLQNWPEISVVAHCSATTDRITDNHGHFLNAAQLITQMKNQGLGKTTRRIVIHACNAGGGKFEQCLQKELKRHSNLKYVTVSGYAGLVGRGADGRPVVEPQGYSASKRGHRHARVVPRTGHR